MSAEFIPLAGPTCIIPRTDFKPNPVRPVFLWEAATMEMHIASHTLPCEHFLQTERQSRKFEVLDETITKRTKGTVLAIFD